MTIGSSPNNSSVYGSSCGDVILGIYTPRSRDYLMAIVESYQTFCALVVWLVEIIVVWLGILYTILYYTGIL